MIIQWFRNWLRERERQIDVELLWKACLRVSGTREDAEIIFRVHMEIDPAYKDLSDREKSKFIEGLP